MSSKNLSPRPTGRLIPIILGIILAAMIVLLLITVAVLLGVWPH